MIAATLLAIAGVYLFCGLLFAIPFVLVGVGKIDPHAQQGSWGFRLLIILGTMFLWPLLAQRWVKGVHEPPEERNPMYQRWYSASSPHSPNQFFGALFPACFLRWQTREQASARLGRRTGANHRRS
jgi:hypothetical protein